MGSKMYFDHEIESYQNAVACLQLQNEKLRVLASAATKYCEYVCSRMDAQIVVINKLSPEVARSILDDFEDAYTVSGLDKLAFDKGAE